MRKSQASDGRSGSLIRIAFTFGVVAFGCSDTAAAAVRAGWPRATYYTVVARAGDTVDRIASRYHVAPSLIGKLNDLKIPGRVIAGRVVVIPAVTRAIREAVRYEAMNRHAPNYATRPGALVVARSVVSTAPRMASIASLHWRAAAGIHRADAGQPKQLRFGWPIAGPVISSFGPGAQGTRNDGINIAAERGAPFRAAADGTVSYAGPLRGYGNLVLIMHRHSYITAYAHADQIAVVRGEFVEKGQVIGTAGITGGVDQPQLHFEIRRGVTAIDPSLLLGAGS